MHGSFLSTTRKLAMVLMTLCPVLSGCPKPDEVALVTTLQSSLNSLVQNKALTDHFVRDIKATVSPSDPAYQRAMDSYADARSAYNEFLDDVENGVNASHKRSLRPTGSREVRDLTADFLADAQSALRPTVSSRRSLIQRTVVIPDELAATFAKVPKKQREKFIDDFDEEVRWRAWSDFN